MNLNSLKKDRVVVIYEILAKVETIELITKDLTLEQTVEIPASLVPDGFIREYLVGHIESIKELHPGVWTSEISYSPEGISDDLPQLLNTLYGNTSIKPGIKITGLILPESQSSYFPGPRFGVAGLRKLTGIQKRPLTCTALKPLGLTSQQLSEQAYQFALGGIDFIKDDHGITNQSFSPFQERLELCVEAVDRANRQTGLKVRYVPNITGPSDQIIKRAFMAKNTGAGGVLIAPGLTGFDVMRLLASDEYFDLPILSHPAFIGSFLTSKENGISLDVLLGQLVRLSGADITIFPNYGGRFSFTKEDCLRLVDACSNSFGNRKTILPAPAGGMSLERVHEMVATYGLDFMPLIGGALQQDGKLRKNAENFIRMMESL